MKKILFTIAILISSIASVKSQLLVSNTLTPAQLAQLISGPGVQILNPVVHCGLNGYGKYNATNSNLNITEGLLLTTGKITNAIGPNDSTNTTWYFGNKFSANTYTLLNNYTGKTTWEYCEFEFDIIPQGDTIKFDFVFASEEYQEWVGSQYNDVFGFFISGPGITGDPGAGVYHNIALLPNGITPVTINGVNQNTNTAYYQNNNNGASVEYDGFTKGLKAISKVTPCQTYHLKLVVADVSDKLWDSGVFIEKISSNNVILLSQTAGGIPNMVEGCNNGTVIFNRQIPKPTPLTINYWIGGTATNGTDYPLIGANPSPGNPKTIIIPANQTTVGLNIAPIADGLVEGTEYMTIYLGNPMCANAINDSLRFYIQDSLFTTVSPIIDSICIGQSVPIITTGGGSAWSWLPAAGLNSVNIANPIASPTVTTIYTLATTASSCSMIRKSKINVSNIVLSYTTTNVSCNGANNGSITLNASGGFPAYTYTWSGPAFSSTLQNISGLAPGIYTVNVKGKKGCVKSTTVSITQPSVLTATLNSPTYNGGFNVACNTGTSGSANSNVSGGTSPYTYTWSSVPTQTTANAGSLSANTYSLNIKDANNCLLTKTITLTQPLPITTSVAAQQNVLCFGNSTGTSTLNTNGGTAPYSYTWSTVPAQSGSVATNLAAGNYTINIKDGNNCTSTKTLAILQPTSAITASISSLVNVACAGNSTGSASISAQGGTAPYTYSWNTTPMQTNAQAVSLAAGNYAGTVKDANNCSVSLPITISQPASNVSGAISSQSNVSCFSGTNGAVTILASGGVPAYTYSWNTVPTQTTATASNLIAGTYNVIIKDQNNCSYTLQANVTQPAAALSATISSQTNVLCFGNSSGSATGIVSGGTPAYTYSWSTSPMQASSTATGLAVGGYTLVVKDLNNCSTTKTVAITQPTSAVTGSISSKVNVLCNGASTGSATVNASGGVSPYTYTWSTVPAQNLASATGLAAGNYTVTVKDANNCLTYVSVNISQPATALSASISNVMPVLCRGNSTGAATVVASGGSGSYSFSWNSTPTQTTAIASGLPAGNYTVTVTDNNGCLNPVTRTVNISQPAASLTASSSSPLYNGNNISCNAGSNGSINLTPTGGTPSYTFVWNGPGGFSSNNEDLNNLSAGVYSVLITDANGCIKNYSTTLTEPTLINLSTTITPATCPAFNDGAIALNATGGTPAYTYSWTGPAGYTANIGSIAGLVAGNYSLTVTDLNGCTKSNVYNVSQPGALAITNTVSSFPGGLNVSCNGYSDGDIGSVNVTGGTPVYTYLWTGPGSFTSTSANITSLVSGVYQLVVTDLLGCTISKTVNLIQPAAIAPSYTTSIYNGGFNITCNGAFTGSLNSSSTGGTPAYSYAWNGPAGYSSGLQNINALQAGTYTLTVTDINSCTGSATVNLTEPNTLTTSVSSPTVAGGYNISCNGASNGAINLNIGGGNAAYTYTWSGPLGYTSNQQNPTGLSAGAYTVDVTDANGCTSSKTITLTQPASLSLAVNSPTVIGGYNITCYGNTNGAVTLTVSGGASPFTFAWTGAGAFTSNLQNISNLQAGSYSVLVTDANGCITNTNITLTQPSTLTSSANSATVAGGYNITCNGAFNGSITLNANGGSPAYSYFWNGPGSYTSNVQNPTGLEAGVYNYSATDANGCLSTGSITLTQPNLISTNLSSPTFGGGYNVSCSGYTNGAINLVIGGGTPGFTYLWSGPLGYTSNAQSPSGLAAGNYNVLVTDQNGCTKTSTIALTQPSGMSGSISSGTYTGGYNVTCNGSLNGTITQTLSGGTLPYTIIWNNGTITQNLVNVGAGTYSVIVIDVNNCSITQSITLTQPPTLFATQSSPSFFGGYNIKCNGGLTGTVTLGVIGGTSPYAFNWVGPAFTATTQNINNVGAGTYTATVTDINSCTYVSTITLTQPGILTAALNSPTLVGGYNISCNGANNGAITTTINGGTQTYQYIWNGPLGYTATAANINNLAAGNYTVLVTDTNLCVTSNTITLTQPNTLTATTTSTIYAGGYNISCFGLSDGDINLNVIGGTPAYTYSWSGPGGYNSLLQNINGLAAGNYSLSLTDANGCIFNTIKTLTEPTGISNTITPSMFIGGNNISCPGATNGTLQLNINGGVAPYTQLWNGPLGYTAVALTLNNLSAGVYSVTITDQNNCIKNSTINLTQPANITQTLTTTNFVGGFNIKCKGDSSGVIWNNVLGGTPGYTYTWNGPNGFSANTKDIFNIKVGTYTVLVTDTNGCVNTGTMSLSQPSVNLTGTVAVTNVLCNGNSTGALNLNYSGGTPGFSIWWRGPNDFTSDNQNISGLTAGNYFVVLKDTNGCQFEYNIDLTEPDALALTFTTSNPPCAGVNNGSVNITVTGGVTPYTYQWSNGTILEDAVGLGAGTYSVIYTDNNGCKDTSDVTIIPAQSNMQINKVINNVKCFKDSTASISLSTTGGNTPYSYLWNNGFTTNNLINLKKGTYIVVVTDAIGCKLNDTIKVTQPDSLNIVLASPTQFNGHNVSQFSGNDGAINLTVYGGTSPYSYLWSNNSTSKDLINITSGGYNVVVVDSNGCKANAFIILTEPLSLELPTGYSPNGDGKNDNFVVRGIEAFPINSITIFNRWGNEVYTKLSYKNEWDGKNNSDNTLPDGTYFVILNVNRGEIILKGYVELRR